MRAPEVKWGWDGRGHRALGKFLREVQPPSSPLAVDQPVPRISLPLEPKCFNNSQFIFEKLQTKPRAALVSHGSLVFPFPEQHLGLSQSP